MTEDLIARLESATEGSRELDVAVLAGDGGPVDMGVERYTEYVRREWARCGELQTWLDEVPHYTTSMDAALTLVPEGAGWSVGGSLDVEGWMFGASVDVERDLPALSSCCVTPTIALVVAALKARKAMETVE